MAGNVFALLVGINQYDPSSSVPALQGCSNDVKAMAAYLQGRVAQDKGSFQLQSLLNEQATRQAVIDGFRSHLCQAGPDDVALFLFVCVLGRIYMFFVLQTDRLLFLTE